MKKVYQCSFKTKMYSNGSTTRNVMTMYDNGVIIIEQQLVADKLLSGFKKIREFKGIGIYQFKYMGFKFDSFMTFAKEVSDNIELLDKDKIERINDYKKD